MTKKPKWDSSQGWFKIPGRQEGRWGLDRQGRGLDIVRQACGGATILDLGCAEGLVALDLAKYGARLVHGVELETSRLKIAAELFRENAPHVEASFFAADLTHFDDLLLMKTPDTAPGEPSLLTRYDVVLCLAIAQKLSNPGPFLRLAATVCSNILAVRLPYRILDDARSGNVPVDVTRMVSAEFDLVQETAAFPEDVAVPYQGEYGWLGVFKRRASEGPTPRR
jgi:SAM-dependent methyltransferase